MTTVNQESRSKNSCSFLFPLPLLFKQKTGRRNNKKTIIPFSSFLIIFIFEKKEEDERDQKRVMSIFSLVPSPCFHFLKRKRGMKGERRWSHSHFLHFPLPSSLKGKKRKMKRKGEFEECNCAFFFSRPFKKTENKTKKIPLSLPFE
jgi:hypothetical protein